MKNVMFARVAAIAALLFAPVVPTMAAPQDAAAAAATTVQPSAALTRRINGLVPIIKGEGDYDSYFHSGFRAQVPKAQFDAIGKQLTDQFGAPIGVESVKATNPNAAEIVVGFERGVVTMTIQIEAGPPNSVIGLLVKGASPRNDSATALETDFRALPGNAGFGIYALADTGITAVHQLNGTVVAPLGSAFKLWILAEAARSVNAGERQWSDVIRLGERSLPSGISQSWPEGSPVTLHTLATLMMSLSDNTATDALLTALGRDKVDAIVRATGVADPDRTLPVLSTMEAFRLKTDAAAGLARDWARLTPDRRRALLRDNAALLAGAKVDASLFANGPRALQIEWFGSPRDEAAVLDWLRRNGGETTLGILGVNAGTPLKDRFAYVGFKGGSEPGVITLNYLVRRQDGRWFAVTGNWNRTDGEVETARFLALMGRALALALAA